MTVQAQLADGRILEFPDGTDPKVIQATVKRVIASSEAAPEEGILASGIGGFKRFGAGLETALGSIIDPEIAARRGLQRQQEISAQYAPGASLEKVKQAYEREGLLSAAGEAISQVPAALAEQFPNIAATIAGGKAGAMAGTAVAPGPGTIIGGLTGAALPSLLQLYGSNLVRQQEETPGEISRTAALGAAVPGTALEVASTAIPLGRTFIGKILGPEAEKMLARGTSASLEKAAKEGVAASLARGAGVGVLAEIPTEVTQQMLERLQAGLPLTTPDALSEYGEAAYGAGLVGAPFGAGARAAGRSSAQAQYAALKQKEDEAAFEQEKAAALARRQEELAAQQEQLNRTRENLGLPETPVLALPAPAQTAEPEKEVDLQNPVGNITREELSPEVLKYVDQYRKDMGMPRLKSFSVEDIRDAMTNVNPQGEQAALDSILAFKTGFKGEETFSADDVINAAVEKNIATETKGFGDFLERTTGNRDITKLSQPQLYTAFKSLKDLPAVAPGEQVVLPEGSNASRFTQKQYNNALKYVGVSFQEMGNQPLAREVISQDVMDAAGLESQRAAEMLLDTALKNGDLSESRQQVFRTIDPKTGEIKFTYFDRAKAEAAAKKQKLDVQEQTLVSIAPKEAPKPSPRAPLPGGFDIAEQSFVEGERPAGFAITPEGQMKPLVTILEEQDVPAKIERLQGLRRKEADKLLQDVSKHEQTVKKGRAALESMEARGETDTDGYKKAQAQQARAEDILGRRIESLLNRIEEYGVPLQAKPVGKRQVTRKGFTVSKEGKTVGTFPTRAEAEQSILANLSDKELQEIVDSGKQGAFLDRAQKELDGRKTPGIKVKKSPKSEEQIKQEQEKAKKEAERDERVQKLEELLVPLLSKFGLKDVALKIVDQIEHGAGGKYSSLQKLIQISLEADKPVQTMRHEALHALKNLGFFTPQQWKALEQQAKKTWVDKYLKGQMTELEGKVMTRFDAYKELGYSEADILEEAIADAFGDFDGGTKPPPGMMAALFKRIKDFFAALKRALTGAGYESAEDIFGKIEEGKLAKQIEKVDEAAEKLSLPTEYKIVKAYVGTSSGGERAAWNVVDARDNFIYDTFSLKRDAQAWVDQAVAAKPSEANAWQADEATIKQADKFEEETGIRPYVSEGFLDLPTEAPKYSLQKFNPEKHLKFDPTLGVPINKDGTVTVYYHTTKQNSLNIGRNKVIPSEGRNRVYLTNESGGDAILRNRGSFDQDLDGSTVLVYVTPDMLQLDAEYENGRRDFFIPLAQGDFFNKKMKMQSIQKGRQEAITGEFSYDDHEKRITKAVQAYKDATPAERKKLVANARKLLKKEHNVGNLLSENGKLEKTRVGEYGLDYEGNSVASQGLGLAAAQKISEKVSTCPRSAICEGLCLGETSGGNFMFGGTASEDVDDIAKSAFRAGPRMMQYLKTEALVINPEAFATVLQAEIDSLKKWSAAPTQTKINKETKKREQVAKEIYQPAVRLNVTSDFKPEMFRAVIEGNPDVQFYDYTKLGSDSIGPNHHLTYSSTGFGQVINGEAVFFKNKAGQYDHNWATMRGRLNDGQNVAMAFSSKSALPDFLVDEETGVQYRVWDGDDYDARFLDPKQPDGRGMIIGLRNKAGNLSEKNATQKTGGFFVKYDPKTDGDTVVVPTQAQFKGAGRKVISLAKAEKLSLRTYFPTAEEAEKAAYAKAPPETKEFKRWFGASGVIDEGRPQVMYHASMEDFSMFRENRPIFISPDAKFAEDFIKRRISEAKSLQYLSEGKQKTAKVYPLWVRAETLFDYNNPDHVQQIVNDVASDYLSKGNIYLDKHTVSAQELTKQLSNGVWDYVEDPRVQKSLKKLGFDSFTVKEGGHKHIAVLSANQVKSATGNLGDFGENKDIRFSLPTVDPRINERVDMITTTREQKGFAQRITEAISPKTFSTLRQKFLNRYEQLGRYDKLLAERMGGAALLADQSAESAALMSDLASGVSASAMGFGDRHGGIPVYRGGTTIINRDVKGLVASLAPLAQYGNPKVYQYYQFWAGAKRARRLRAEGRERVYTDDDFAYADILERQFPEFVGVQKDLIAFNDGIVKYLVDTQVLSKEQGESYTQYADYIPFYRQMDGETTSGPNIFSAISGVRPPKKLKGGDAPLADFLETLVRNTQSSIEAGMKNAAANRAISVVKRVGDAPGVGIERLDTQESGPNIINVLENGKRVSYRTPDTLLVDAVSSLNMSELPFMGLISGPSNLLRNLVTKDPGFMMANLLRDSLSAYVTSGQSMTPIAGTVAKFGKALAGKSPEIEALLDAGLGGYEFNKNVERSGEALARDLDKKAGKKDPILMRPFTSLWEALEKGTTASDLATRSLVYERVLAETGNEAEALYRAVEVMNFNRKGNSPLIRVLTAAVPFFNARLQGLDLFYRASTGNMNTNDAKAIQRKFWTRGATMMGLSVMYYMMVADDDEYKKQEQETKDGNWLIPSLGIRIPIPFEVGVLFKTLPERITALYLGNDTGKDFMESAKRNFFNTFAFNPIPQTVKPIVEATTNFNFFTMRPIVGQGMEDVASQFQVGPGTSKVAEIMGKQLGISPMKIDHMLKGYTGTIGVYMVDTTDLIMEQFGTGTKANKRFEQMPVIKRFTVDPEARGNITGYYELKDSVDTFTRTSNLLEKTSKPEEFLAYVKKNAGVFAVKDYVLDLEKEMKELREMRRMVTSSDMDGEEKKNLLITLGRAENNLTANIQTVKKVIASAK